MNNDVKAIKQMLDSCQFNEVLMREIITHYQYYPAVLPCRIFAGAKIIRSSFNEENEFHSNVSRLNYPPKQFARTDRVSLKGKPVFYGSVFTSAYKNGAYPRVISALETTDVLRGYEKTGKVFTTQSLWLSDFDLKLIALPFSKLYKKPCEEILSQRKFWNEKYSHYWPSEYVTFSEFISDLIATQNYSCLYDVTATTIDYLLNESTLVSDVDGIMYPSVWGEGEGMNICLKTDVVDKHLHFQHASVQLIEKSHGEATMLGIADSVLYNNGDLKWKITEPAFKLLRDEYGVEHMLRNNMIDFGEKPNELI